MIYPLFIFKIEEGFDGYFPDADGCFFAGNTLEEAIRVLKVLLVSIWKC